MNHGSNPGTPRQRNEDIATMRASVLGQMHGGKMVIEEKHPFLRQMVRLSIVSNILCIAILRFLFFLKDMFPPHDQPFMPALTWIFLFGIIYGLFAQMLFSFGRFAEQAAVTRALTHNRRYEWHSRYDTAHMSEEDLKKVAGAPKPPPQQQANAPRSSATGAGGKNYTYSMLFVLCAFVSCGLGIHAFINSLL